MQKLFFVLAIVGVFCASPIFAEGILSPELVQAMENQRGGQFHVMISLKQDVSAANLVANNMVAAQGEEFKAQVFGMLQSECQASQHFLKALVNRLSETGNVSAANFFWISNSVSMQADAQAIRELAAQPDIFTISLDEEQVMISPVVAEETRDGLWGLQAIKVADAHAKGYKGQGVTVVVTDTGLNLSHSAFAAGQIVTAKCKSFVPGEATVEDGNGHGTHCAGTILSKPYGIAHEAKLISVKVLSAGGSGTWEGVQQGVEYACTVGDIVSMSLGGGASANGNVVETAVKNGIASGVFFAIAAGNSGPSTKTIGTPGVVEEACTVGAIQEGGSIANFSSRGPTVYGKNKPDVVAPGVNVLSAWKSGGTNTISGTSMATPHVAGLAALILGKNKSLKPADVKRILMSTASGTKGDNVFGSGMIRCDQALNMVVAASEVNSFDNSARLSKEVSATTDANGGITLEKVLDVPFDIVVTGVKSTMTFPQANCVVDGKLLWNKPITSGVKNPTSIVVKAGNPVAKFVTGGGQPNTKATLTIFFDFAE